MDENVHAAARLERAPFDHRNRRSPRLLLHEASRSSCCMKHAPRNRCSPLALQLHATARSRRDLDVGAVQASSYDCLHDGIIVWF